MESKGKTSSGQETLDFGWESKRNSIEALRVNYFSIELVLENMYLVERSADNWIEAIESAIIVVNGVEIEMCV